MKFLGGKRNWFLLVLLPLLSFRSDTPSRVLHVTIQPMFGNKQFSFDSSYVNAAGESLQVTKCLFYLSNFSITYSDGKKTKLPASYFLVDLSNKKSCQIQLPTENKKILSIHFLLGIDSVTNVRGIQKGVLDPVRGMFWTWNTGYVMAKLEGISSASTMPGKKFSYHVGGYAGNQNVIKSIDLSIPASPENKIVLLVDLLRWFNGPSPISIAQQPNCHSPGELAQKIAGNYQSMFSIQTTPIP